MYPKANEGITETAKLYPFEYIIATRADIEKYKADGYKYVFDSELLKTIMTGERAQVEKMRKSEGGKYKVIALDKYDGSNWTHGSYETESQALKEAREMTKDAMGSATDADVATIYHAYDPEGKYLGGDVWKNE